MYQGKIETNSMVCEISFKKIWVVCRTKCYLCVDDQKNLILNFFFPANFQETKKMGELSLFVDSFQHTIQEIEW